MAQENQNQTAPAAGREVKTTDNMPQSVAGITRAVGDFVHGTRKADNAAADMVSSILHAVTGPDVITPETVTLIADDEGEVTFGDLVRWTRNQLKKDDGSADVGKITAIKTRVLAASTHGAKLLKELSAASDIAADKSAPTVDRMEANNAKTLLTRERNAAFKMIERASFITVAYVDGCAFNVTKTGTLTNPTDKQGNDLPGFRSHNGTLAFYINVRGNDGDSKAQWYNVGIGAAEKEARKHLRPDSAKQNPAPRGGGNQTAAPTTQAGVVQFSPEAFGAIVADEGQTRAALDAVRGLIARLDAKDAVAKHKDALRDLIDDVITLAVDAGLASRVASELKEAQDKRGGNGKAKEATKA